MRVSFAFSQRNYVPDERVIELVATVEVLSSLCRHGKIDGVQTFVMNCNCK